MRCSCKECQRNEKWRAAQAKVRGLEGSVTWKPVPFPRVLREVNFFYCPKTGYSLLVHFEDFGVPATTGHHQQRNSLGPVGWYGRKTHIQCCEILQIIARYSKWLTNEMHEEVSATNFSKVAEDSSTYLIGYMQ
jgi:hypothetical protein